MGIFDFAKDIAKQTLNSVAKNVVDSVRNKTSNEDEYYSDSHSEDCPYCGELLVKRYSYSEWYCPKCGKWFDDDLEEDDEWLDDDDDGESLSVYEAAEIWASHGKDEDYMFGYTEEELEDAL